MWSFGIIKVQVTTERSACFWHAGVGAQMDLLVLDRFPNPLDKNIISDCAPFSIHADFDAILEEHLRKSHAGELRALVHTALEPMARDVHY